MFLKELINYHYEIIFDEIIEKNDYILLKKDNTIYYLYKVSDLKQVSFQADISINNPYYHSFVINKNNSIFSKWNDYIYVLLKQASNMSFFSYLKEFSIIKFSWYERWIIRSDFLEDIYSKIKGNYEVVDDSFDYYLGLLEMAIFYIRDYENNRGMGYVQNIKYSSELFHNPLNICIDYKERDFAEYLKDIFWNGEYQSIDLAKLIFQNKDSYDFSLVIGRLLYPNYYFDMFDDVVFFNKKEELLNRVIRRSLEYREYFFRIFNEINKYHKLKKVSF